MWWGHFAGAGGGHGRGGVGTDLVVWQVREAGAGVEAWAIEGFAPHAPFAERIACAPGAPNPALHVSKTP
jgi:hypothetical protein